MGTAGFLPKIWLGLLYVGLVPAPSPGWKDTYPGCSHFTILDGEQDRHLAKGMIFERTVTLEEPGPYQLAAIHAALSRMTHLPCQSVGGIAFGKFPGDTSTYGAVNSCGAGDMILINTNNELSEESLEKMISRRLFLQRTIIREAGQSAENLLNLESSSPPKGYSGQWGRRRDIDGMIHSHLPY